MKRLLLTLAVGALAAHSWSSVTLDAYHEGFLDRANMIGLEHFKKLPDSIRTTYNRYTKNATAGNYEAFINSVLAEPSFLGGVKLLFDATYKTNRIDQLVNAFGSRGYFEGAIPNRDYLQLDFLYLQRLCDRNRIATHPCLSFSSTRLYPLLKSPHASDEEFAFAISEVSECQDLKLTRELLENILSQRPNDYRLHIIAVDCYVVSIWHNTSRNQRKMDGSFSGSANEERLGPSTCQESDSTRAKLCHELSCSLEGRIKSRQGDAIPAQVCSA